MKQLIPYVFPLIALAIVVVLILRWYYFNTNPTGSIPNFGEQVQVKELSPEEETVMRGAKDYKSAPLNPTKQPNETTNFPGSGEVRYTNKEGRVSFTVFADLPTPEDGEYQVWLRDSSGTVVKPIFSLTMSKGGYMGSTSIASEVLPVEILVSLEKSGSDTPTVIILQGSIPREE